MALPILARTITSALVKKGSDAKKESKKVSAEKLLPGSTKTEVRVSKFRSRTPRTYRKNFKPTKFLPPSKIDENFDMEKLDNLLASLVDNTKDLKKVTKKDVDDEKKKVTQKKNVKEKLKRSKREEETEEKKAVTKVKSSPVKLKTPDFLKEVLAMGGRLVLATGVMTLLNFLTDPERKDGIFKFLENNLDKVLIGGIALTAGAILLPLTPLFGAVLGLGKILLLPLTIALGFVGKVALKALNIIRRGGGSIGRGGGRQSPRAGERARSGGSRVPAGIGPRPQTTTGGAGRFSRSDTRGNQRSVQGSQYRQNLNRIVKPGQTPQGVTQPVRPSRFNRIRTTFESATKFGGRTARTIFNLPGQVQRVSGSALRYGRQLFSFTKGLMSRVPFFGAILEGVMTYFEDTNGDGQPDKKIDKALFTAGGTAIGGLIGSFVPIPFLGTLVGSIVGKYFGELMYELLRGGGWRAVAEKIQRDALAALNAGKAAAEWLGGGFSRFYQGLEKDTYLGRFQIPKLKYINLFNEGNRSELGALLKKSFFQGESGEEQLLDIPEPEIMNYEVQQSSPPDPSQNISYQAPYEKPGVEVAFVKVPTPVPMPSGGSGGGGRSSVVSGGNVNRYEDLVVTTHYREA